MLASLACTRRQLTGDSQLRQLLRGARLVQSSLVQREKTHTSRLILCPGSDPARKCRTGFSQLILQDASADEPLLELGRCRDTAVVAVTSARPVRYHRVCSRSSRVQAR